MKVGDKHLRLVFTSYSIVSSSPFPFHPVHVSGASPPDIIKNKKQEFQRHQLFFILHSSFFISEYPLCQRLLPLDTAIQKS